MALTGTTSWSGRERNCFFLNTGAGQYADISAVSGFDFIDDGRAAATVDWDFDGDQDIWIVNRTGPQLRFVRNETPAENHFLALRLSGNGKTTNADAIGARVEVLIDGKLGKSIKTLHAGEGYLSQSSKWMYFGLGASSQVESIVVRWPGGKPEEWRDLTADRFYKVVQGKKPVEWTPPQRSIDLKPSELATSVPTGTARTLLTKRFSLPELSYRDFQNQSHRLADFQGEPVLLNLWAPWCQICLAELVELQASEQTLRKKGLHILALSAEETDATKASEAAQDLLSKMGYSFDSGVASQEQLNKIEVLIYSLLVMQKPIPLPCSLLIDAKGQVATIYRGKLSVEQLIDDIEILDVAGEDLRSRALPFPGREYHAVDLLSSVKLATRFAEDRFADDALQYLSQYEQHVASGQEQPGHRLLDMAHYNLAIAFADQGRVEQAISHYEQAVAIKPENVKAHFNLAALKAERGDVPGAIGGYEAVIQIDPNYTKARNNLSLILQSQGQIAAAEQQLRAALSGAPKNIDVLNNLGNLLVRNRRAVESIDYFRQALQVDDRDARTHYNLGVAYVQQRDFRTAASHFRTVTQHDPKNVQAHHNLSASLAQLGDLDEAEAYARQTISLAPNYRPAQSILQRILELKEQVPQQ